jgi:hypothetical protein
MHIYNISFLIFWTVFCAFGFKVISKTSLTNMSKSEKSAYFCHVFANNFLWCIFPNLFQRIRNQPDILRFFIPILNFEYWIEKKNFFNLISTFFKLWLRMRRKWLKKTKNLFLWMCLRIYLCNHQRVCITKLYSPPKAWVWRWLRSSPPWRKTGIVASIISLTPPPGESPLQIKGTVSWDRFQKCWQKFTELGLTKERGWFLNFCRGSNDFKTPKSIFIGVHTILSWLNNS